MLVAKLVEPYRFELLDQPIPTPGPDEVVLKNVYLGVCTSDLQIYHGKHAYAAMPVVLGHEEAGIVYQVGGNVTDWRPGDFSPSVSAAGAIPAGAGILTCART